MLFITATTLRYVFPPIMSNGFRASADVIRGTPVIFGIITLWEFGIYFYHNAIRDRIYKYSDRFLSDVMTVLEHYTTPYGVSEMDIPILMRIQGGMGVERIMNQVNDYMVNSAIHIIQNDRDPNIHSAKNNLNRLFTATKQIGLYTCLELEEVYSEAQKVLDKRKQEKEKS